MAVSRLYSQSDPQGEARQCLARLLQQKRADAVLNRLAAFATNSDMAPGMFDRLLNFDALVVKRTLQALESGMMGDPVSGVSSVGGAVSAAGLQSVRRVAMVLLLEELVREPLRRAGLPPMEFVSHAVGTATAAHFIADRIEADPELCWSAGLIHNIGVAGLTASLPDAYAAAVRALAGSASQLHEAEMFAFGYDHQTVGGLIAKQFNMPTAISDAMTSHHNPHSLEGPALAVAVGSVIAHQLGCDLGLANSAPEVPEALLRKVRLRDSHFQSLADSISRALSGLKQMPD